MNYDKDILMKNEIENMLALSAEAAQHGYYFMTYKTKHKNLINDLVTYFIEKRYKCFSKDDEIILDWSFK